MEQKDKDTAYRKKKKYQSDIKDYEQGDTCQGDVCWGSSNKVVFFNYVTHLNIFSLPSQVNLHLYYSCFTSTLN